MKLVSTIAAVLFLSSFCFTQIHLDSLDKARQIKLLHADRESVRSALNQFALDEGDDSDDFESADAEIGVSYSTGTCDEDESEVWNVVKGKAVRIEIEPKGDLHLADFGFTLSDFTREQRLADVEDNFVFHNKAKGIAIYVDSGVVERIVLFPPITSKAKVCKYKEARGFISHKSWFGSTKLEDRRIIFCPTVSVIDLVLSHDDMSATVSRRIDISTTANNPLNDVISYVYHVSGGKVVGKGSKVIWDLTGLPAGRYTITAGVDNGAGILGQTKTMAVLVN